MSPRWGGRSCLVLIGMPASGKSTLGVLAAKALGLDFLDTDLLLQRSQGRKLSEILEGEGPHGFFRAENELLGALEIASCVVATGGSAVHHEQGMARLASLGLVVYLEASLREIEERLVDAAARGVVLLPGQSLAELFREREPLYRRWAEVIVPVKKERLESSLERLLESVGQPR